MREIRQSGSEGGESNLPYPYNPTLIGWFGYFKHSNQFTFTTVDKWIRMRLRSILRRRAGRKGRGRGADHHRYRNAFFTDRGYFSLEAAYESLRRSPLG